MPLKILKTEVTTNKTKETGINILLKLRLIYGTITIKGYNPIPIILLNRKIFSTYSLIVSLREMR